MKIISGGQTGVDLAALNFAHEHKIPYGGWVPKGRTNEAGLIPEYLSGLTETASEEVAERTRLNVMSSDATLIFGDGSDSPGTRQTIAFASDANKPLLLIDTRDDPEKCAGQVRDWILTRPIAILNVAGPRNSEAPGIGKSVQDILQRILPVFDTGSG